MDVARFLDGSKEGGPCHIQIRHDGLEQHVPFGGVSALQSQCLLLAAVACESQYVAALVM